MLQFIANRTLILSINYSSSKFFMIIPNKIIHNPCIIDVIRVPVIAIFLKLFENHFGETATKNITARSFN